MLKKYHVGKFIKEYMEILGLTDSSLSRISGISRDHIINIKNEKADLSVQAAISIAPYLKVSAEFLMSLQVIYTKYIENLEIEKIDKNVFESITPEFKDIIDNSNINKKTFDFFINDIQKYCEDFSILHYEPKKSNIFKNFILAESLKGFEINPNKLNVPEINSFLEKEYFEKLLNVQNKNSANDFIKYLRKYMFEFGVNIKILKTGLNSTIKGITRLFDDNANVLIENNGEFSKIIWYVTHELSHIVLKNEDVNKKYIEEYVNNMSHKFLLHDYSYALSSIKEDELSEINGVNKYILKSCWKFNKNIHIKSDENDEIYLEDNNDFYSQLQ